MELIFIGDKFYRESSTSISSLYDIEGNRQDWGKVNLALRNGESVYIRPATQKELEFYNRQLKEIKIKLKKWYNNE